MFSRKGEGRTLFDMEDEHEFKTLESVVNAVANAYQIQEELLSDFIENGNISSAMMLMQASRMKRKDRMFLRRCWRSLRYVQRETKLNPSPAREHDLAILTDGAMTYILEVIQLLRPNPREHFLRSVGWDNKTAVEPDKDDDKKDGEEFFG